MTEETAEQGVTMAQNLHGNWVPAIPVPLHVALGRKECPVGNCHRGTRRGARRRFWTLAGYRGHYALSHVLILPEGRS